MLDNKPSYKTKMSFLKFKEKIRGPNVYVGTPDLLQTRL